MKTDKPSSFISKFNALLTNEDHEAIIKFNASQAKIHIFDKKRLQQQILPIYFRHNKFNSFIRQLNLYGFKKVKNQQVLSFTHLTLVNGAKILNIVSKKRAIQLAEIEESDQNQADSNSNNQSKKINNKEIDNYQTKIIIQQNDNNRSTFQTINQSIFPIPSVNYINFPIYGQQSLKNMQRPVYLQPFYYSSSNNFCCFPHSNF